MHHVLAFDRQGGRWRRGAESAADCGERVRVGRVLHERLVMSPGHFRQAVRVTGGPEVTVEWESMVRGAGVAKLGVGPATAVVCLFLTGTDQLAEEMTIGGLAAALGMVVGHPLAPAVAMVRRDRRRPLVAAFRVGDAEGCDVRSLAIAEGALAWAYFGLFESGGADEAVGWQQPAL